MNTNFNVSWSSNWNNNKNTQKRKLTAQEEYWLDRILRDHGKQIFIVLTLFLFVLLGTVIATITNGDRKNITNTNLGNGINITTEVGDGIRTNINIER